MTETRKQYSKEFKLDAISMVLDQGFTRKEASASLEINTEMLGRWIKEFTCFNWTCRDPNDPKFLEAYIDGEADYLITGDKDLLVMKNRELQVLTAEEFLKVASQKAYLAPVSWINCIT